MNVIFWTISWPTKILCHEIFVCFFVYMYNCMYKVITLKVREGRVYHEKEDLLLNKNKNDVKQSWSSSQNFCQNKMQYSSSA